MPRDDMGTALREGMLHLDGVSGYRELSEPSWHPNSKAWWWYCRFDAELTTNSWLATGLRWIVKVSEEYPWGALDILPAKEGGLAVTFPHQNLNAAGDPRVPWREGKLCVTDPLRSLGRSVGSEEPWTAKHRLAWNVRRTLEWLRLASQSKLQAEGDPFELPQYAVTSGVEVVFNEDQETLEHWRGLDHRSGLAHLSSLSGYPDLFFVERFETLQGSTLLESRWGTHVRSLGEGGLAGAWLRFDQPVVEEPWQSPVAWEDLNRWCGSQGLDLSKELERVCQQLRQKEEERAWMLLLGFPILRRVGDPEPRRMHWLALEPPRLAKARWQARGFRAGSPQGLAIEDKKHRKGKISWAKSSSWSEEDLGSRGQFSQELRCARVLIVGAGSLGSQVAEVLARGGVRQIVIIDDDSVEAGNLVRHTLTMEDLGKAKAGQLAKRLCAISPHIEARGVKARFPGEELAVEDMTSFDLIIEATGENQILEQLGHSAHGDELIFCSLGVGLGARRLYCWSGPVCTFAPDSYHRQISSWIDQDLEDMGSAEMPWEGVGCWHPVFPARFDDISLMVSMALKELAWRFEMGEFSENLSIWEQESDEHGFPLGVRRKEPRGVS